LQPSLGTGQLALEGDRLLFHALGVSQHRLSFIA
jgi:hypothetical protein